MKKNIYFFIVGVLAALFAAGCSELKNENQATQSKATIHEKGFADTTSNEFHGKYLSASNYNYKNCQSCHGEKFDGGISNHSCYKCHSIIHDKSFADSTSQNFHSIYLKKNNYDVNSCQSCHGTLFDGKGVTSKSCLTCHKVVHDKSFGIYGSGNYHTKYIRQNQYDILSCQSCHGQKYDGAGVKEKSCLTCHNKQDGPENCGTCHSAVKATAWKGLFGKNNIGVHQSHMNTEIACNSCHIIPVRLLSNGHLGSDNKAEVKFDTITYIANNQIYNSNNQTCSNTYCHGNFKGGNGNVSVTWTDGSGNAAKCGSCHGDVTKTTLEEKAFPKTGHPNIGSMKCNQCHSRTVDANMNIISNVYHVNGKVD